MSQIVLPEWPAKGQPLAAQVSLVALKQGNRTQANFDPIRAVA